MSTQHRPRFPAALPFRVLSACGLAFALLFGTAAEAQIRQVEAVGAFPLAPGARHSKPPRAGAVRMALDEAVRRVALDLVREMGSGKAAELLAGALGGDPFDYTIRYRVVEDRGERPAVYGEDPKVAFEYVVVVEAHIDGDRVERRLEEAGLLAAGRARALEWDLRLVVEDLRSFAAYAALRKALIEGVGVKSVLPVEMERGRADLVVRTHHDAEQLLEALLRSAPPGLVITPVGGPEGVLTLHIALDALREGADSAEPAAAGGSVRDD